VPTLPGGFSPPDQNAHTERMPPTRRQVLATATATTSTAFGGCLGVTGNDGRDEGDGNGRTHRLGFTGDVMLGRSVDEHWRERDPTGVWGSMHDHLLGLDGLFLNLECTISARGSPRPGRTYHFRAHPDWAVAALESVGTSWVSLANNHLLDFGAVALRDTRTHLTRAGVAHAGAGADVAAATTPSLVPVGDLDVAVVAFTDQSASYAALPGKVGTAYTELDPRDLAGRWQVGSALREAHAGDPDLTVASLHWGPNWDPTPAKSQRRFARWLVDNGVDVVHGHSAHIVQGVEVYRGRPIIYDAGDFVDDYIVKDGLHNDWSFLFEVEIEDGIPTALRLVPVEIDDETVNHPGEEAATWLRARMRTLSKPFGTRFERTGDGLALTLE
jgi:poly-gamma-glutamate capsule biosynthesis protein CapA/YwtB (metallophosphatase superfamily)